MIKSSSVSYCSSPVIGRGPELGISFNDNDRDNIEDVDEEEKSKNYIGATVVENREQLEELEDDSDYGGSGDHESQVFVNFLISFLILTFISFSG